MGLHVYWDLWRPMQQAAWEDGGYTEAEIAYKTEIMDANHYCETRFKGTKFFLRLFRFIPFCSALLAYWEDWEEAYRYTKKIEAREKYLDHHPDNIVYFEDYAS